MAQEIAQADQNTWQNAYREAIKDLAFIKKDLNLNLDGDFKYPCFIPKRLYKRIKESGHESALWKQFIPNSNELSDNGTLDPIGDKKNAKGNGIIHRYKNRILFTPTTNCPVLCRYCFRKNELTEKDQVFKHSLDKLAHYLSIHPEVNEVILTGGDPLILSTSKLIQIKATLIKQNIPFLRFHTRTPVILPERIDDELIKFFKQASNEFTRVILVLHTNHIDELDTFTSQQLLRLQSCGVDLLTQSVLLKGINDTKADLLNLFYKLISLKFSPYYLHHPDQARGAMHFNLPIETGRYLYNSLRNELPGWAIPTYIIDHPSGHGKQLAFNPEQLDFSGKLLNLKGQKVDY